MKISEQLIQLVCAYADNLAAQVAVLRQLTRVLGELTPETPDIAVKPSTVSSQVTVSIPMRICHSGEEHFIPLTEKDSEGKQIGVICNNSWGLMENPATDMVKYPSGSIESITKEISSK